MKAVFRYSERRISISRTLSAILAILTILAAGVVFEEKREAGRLSSDVARLKRGIEQEKERISELKAEWALLDQPARLQSIIEANPDEFALAPILPTQIGRVGDLPWRPAPEPEEADEDASPAAGEANAHPSATTVAAAPPRAADPVAGLLERVVPPDPPTTGSVTPAVPPAPTVQGVTR